MTDTSATPCDHPPGVTPVHHLWLAHRAGGPGHRICKWCGLTQRPGGAEVSNDRTTEPTEPRGCPTPGACSAAVQIARLRSALKALTDRAFRRNLFPAEVKVALEVLSCAPIQHCDLV